MLCPVEQAAPIPPRHQRTAAGHAAVHCDCPRPRNLPCPGNLSLSLKFRPRMADTASAGRGRDRLQRQSTGAGIRGSGIGPQGVSRPAFEDMIPVSDPPRSSTPHRQSRGLRRDVDPPEGFSGPWLSARRPPDSRPEIPGTLFLQLLGREGVCLPGGKSLHVRNTENPNRRLVPRAVHGRMQLQGLRRQIFLKGPRTGQGKNRGSRSRRGHPAADRDNPLPPQLHHGPRGRTQRRRSRRGIPPRRETSRRGR